MKSIEVQHLIHIPVELAVLLDLSVVWSTVPELSLERPGFQGVSAGESTGVADTLSTADAY